MRQKKYKGNKALDILRPNWWWYSVKFGKYAEWVLYPNTKDVDDVVFLTGNENDFVLLDCGILDGHYFSEDWLFCHRWGKMNGDTCVDVSINLTHTGTEEFKGSLILSMI